MQDLRNLMLILWQRLWLVLAATVLGGVLALWGMVKIGQFPNYSATAVVAIGGDVYYNAQDAAYLEMADAMIENYRRLAGLEIVTSAVVENLNLAATPKDIAKAMDVSLIENSHLLSVKVTYDRPDTAAAIANEVARQLTRLAPAQERNFVLIVETAVPPKLPDITAVIPVMMAAMAAFLTTVGGLLFYAYVKQPILSAADLVHLDVPLLATIDASRKDSAALWWLVKHGCEARWAAKQPETARLRPRHILLTAPVQRRDMLAAANQLAAVWQLDCAAAVVDVAAVAADVPVAGKVGKRPFAQKPQAVVEAAWQASEAYQITIFAAGLTDDWLPVLMLAQRVEMVVMLVPMAHVRLPELQAALALLDGQQVVVDGLVLVKGQLAGGWLRWSRLVSWLGKTLRQRNGRSRQQAEAQRIAESGRTS